MNNKSPKIYADLMRTDDQGRVILDTQGTINDLKKYNLKLSEGLMINFYSDDSDDKGNFDPLIFMGKVEYNSKIGKWTAVIDKDTIKHESENKG